MFQRQIDQLAVAITQLDARLRDVSNLKTKLQAWQAPTLLNSWANLGAGFAVAGYWKDPHGIVHLRGILAGGAPPTNAFVLPVRYRPEYTMVFITLTTNEVDVLPNGSVLIVSNASGGGIALLDGITFRAFA